MGCSDSCKKSLHSLWWDLCWNRWHGSTLRLHRRWSDLHFAALVLAEKLVKGCSCQFGMEKCGWWLHFCWARLFLSVFLLGCPSSKQQLWRRLCWWHRSSTKPHTSPIFPWFISDPYLSLFFQPTSPKFIAFIPVIFFVLQEAPLTLAETLGMGPSHCRTGVGLRFGVCMMEMWVLSNSSLMGLAGCDGKRSVRGKVWKRRARFWS